VLNNLYKDIKGLCKKNQLEWVKVLTQNKEEEVERFTNILHNAKCRVGDAIIIYRTQLFNEGRGVVQYLRLERALREKAYVELRLLLQELFLDYIPENKMKTILSKLEGGKVNISDLYTKHMENPNKRIMMMIH